MKIYIGDTGRISYLKIIGEHKNLGNMLVPKGISLKKAKQTFAFDNGAFSSYVQNKPFDDKQFLKGLKKCLKYKQYCDFAVLPDIVAGGLSSLKFSMEWWVKLPEEIEWYLPIQNGMLPEHIDPLMLQCKSNIVGLFIGGTKEWKYKVSKKWVKYAHDNNLKCHIGRVGTERKVLWAEYIGADSIDSTNFAQNKIHWNQLMGYLTDKQKKVDDFDGPRNEEK